MAIIQATWTNDAIAMILSNLSSGAGERLQPITLFRVGEGGWVDTAAGTVPRTPSPALTDLDCTLNPDRYPTTSRAVYEGAIEDIGIVGSTLVFTCTIPMGSFNDDGNGDFPEIWEIGLFMSIEAGEVMVAYGTMQAQTKTPAGQLTNTVRLSLSHG